MIDASSHLMHGGILYVDAKQWQGCTKDMESRITTAMRLTHYHRSLLVHPKDNENIEERSCILCLQDPVHLAKTVRKFTPEKQDEVLESG